MNKLALAGLILALTGCAVPQQQMVWVKAGATEADFQQARDQCIYEVSAATQQPDYTMRTILGQELDRALRQRDLGIKCMVAKGYHQEPAQPQARSSSKPPPAKPPANLFEAAGAANAALSSQPVTPSAPLPAQAEANFAAAPAAYREPRGQIAPAAAPSGLTFDISKADSLTPGQSTIADAVRLLGEANTETTLFNKTKLLQWISFAGTKGAHLAILFDERGVMQRVQHKTVRR